MYTESIPKRNQRTSLRPVFPYFSPTELYPDGDAASKGILSVHWRHFLNLAMKEATYRFNSQQKDRNCVKKYETIMSLSSSGHFSPTRSSDCDAASKVHEACPGVSCPKGRIIKRYIASIGRKDKAIGKKQVTDERNMMMSRHSYFALPEPS